MQINISIQAISNGILIVIPSPHSTQENPVQPHMQYFATVPELAKFLFDFANGMQAVKQEFNPEVVKE